MSRPTLSAFSSELPEAWQPGPVVGRDVLRHDLHRISPTNWARRANKLVEDPKWAPIYNWSQIADRFQAISMSGRHDHAAFYRHGTTKYNRRGRVSGQHNTLLSEAGRLQANDLAQYLPKSLDLIACSALARTIETMEIAMPRSQRIGIPIVIDPRINEVNLGTLQGRRRAFVSEFGRGDIDFVPPGGESYREAAQRIFSFLVDLFSALGEAGGQPRYAAVFCHAGVLRVIATLGLRTPCASDMFKVNHSNAERLDLEVSKIRLPKFWYE